MTKRKRNQVDYNENTMIKKMFDEDRADELTQMNTRANSKTERQRNYKSRMPRSLDEAQLSQEDSEMSSQMHDSFCNSEESSHNH